MAPFDVYGVTCKEYVKHLNQTVPQQIYEGFEIGAYQVDPATLFPCFDSADLEREKTEWDQVDPAYIISGDPIEVLLNRDGDLVVYDGHHRLKKYLSMGCDSVDIIVVGFGKFYSKERV